MTPPRLPFRRRLLLLGSAMFLAALLSRCAAPTTHRRADAINNLPELGCIVAAGQAQSIGTPVVGWSDPSGYSAYRQGKHFAPQEPPDGKLRYTPLRGALPAELQAAAAQRGALTLAELQQVVRQFVIHFDVAGTSAQCFKILQDHRNLSVHFLLDVDGTIYQTLDLHEKAWHATTANDVSVGVEIAHPGAYPQPMNAAMARFYEQDADGYRAKFPSWLEQRVRTPNFVARPLRPEMQCGVVQGQRLYQLDYTPQQYAALAHLCAGLNKLLPRIALAAPRGQDGKVIPHALTAAQLAQHDGLLGHFHVQKNKTDPGPAFQWELLLQQARALRAKL